MRAAAATLAAALAAALLAACSSTPADVELAPGKSGDGVAQTSVELMAERVPALADAEAVVYYGGYLGEPESGREIETPGPRDYWIDAVVTLAQGEAAALAELGETGDVPEPDVVPPLEDELPECTWESSPQIDAHFAGVDGWWGYASLCAEADIVVLLLVQG